jgi:hypothetical protein
VNFAQTTLLANDGTSVSSEYFDTPSSPNGVRVFRQKRAWRDHSLSTLL